MKIAAATAVHRAGTIGQARPAANRNGLSATASNTRPCNSACAARKPPQNGHSSPVNARSGQAG